MPDIGEVLGFDGQMMSFAPPKLFFWTPDKIRLLRRRLKLTMKAFGALFDNSASAVSTWERGRSHPRWRTMHRMHGVNYKLAQLDAIGRDCQRRAWEAIEREPDETPPRPRAAMAITS